MAPKSFSLAILFFLAGCGLRPPELKEAFDPDLPADNGHVGLSGSSVLEFEIQKKVYCELKEAVSAALAIPTTQGPDRLHQSPSKTGLMDPAWLAEVSLTLQVDESTALNPGVALTQPLPNGLVGFGGSTAASSFQQSFNLGLGGALSQTGTTIDRFDPFWTIEFLARKPLSDSICAIPENPANDPILTTYMRETRADMKSSPLLIDGKLGLKQWLVGALIGRYYLYSVGTEANVVGSPAGAHPDAISHEFKFVVITSGNVTPTWKLVRISTNTASTPFFAINRTRTHDLIITIGPNKPQTTQAHLAAQIGNAVSNANAARAMQ